MNKKRILLIVTIVLLALTLTGCTVPTDENGNVILITLDTAFSEIMDEGIFAAVITYPLAQAINWLEPRVGIALAIAIVTLAINAVVLAFTFKSNVAMQKMQEIQPEMQKIQAKYEGKSDEASQQRMAMEMQQLYAKYNINPIGSLVATFIQFPILIGMYNAVRRSYAVANAKFMGVSLDMTPKEAIGSLCVVCIVIYVLMIITQFLSIKTPTWLAEFRGKQEADAHHKTYKKPQQNQNIFMTYGMLLMIAFIMLSWPTALSLYYVIYSLINICKTLVIDKLTHKD
ncbi:MAG: YidC/Oxa1 family membrane protein insertase [Erysipelotrichaceae bacterium]|nr:YidC/Oxa1 family membrane protein insertase [Erysipelotrichaceae bacterium]